MTPSDNFKIEQMRENLKRSLDILEGMSPAGPPSETGCGDAERRNSQTTPSIPHGSAIAEAKDGGKLQRVLKSWRQQADWHITRIRECEAQKLDLPKSWNEGKSAALIGCIADLEAALSATPRTQSGEEEVEECPSCNGRSIFENKDGALECMVCGVIPARGKRMERSGLRNAEGEATRSAPERARWKPVTKPLIWVASTVLFGFGPNHRKGPKQKKSGKFALEPQGPELLETPKSGRNRRITKLEMI